MPVIPTSPEQWETWLTAPAAEALVLQRPLPDGSLVVVARGSKMAGAPGAWPRASLADCPQVDLVLQSCSPPAAPKIGGDQMTLSAISHYSGGAIEEVAPLAKALKAIYLKYGVGYRLSRFETGPNKGDWFVMVTYLDATAYEAAQARFAQDRELQQVFIRIAKFAKRISRELVTDFEL